jgi:hypothetical protein
MRAPNRPFPYRYRRELSDDPADPDGRPHLADHVAHCRRFDPDHAAIPQLHRSAVLNSQRPAGSRTAEVAAPLIPKKLEPASLRGLAQLV